MITLDMLYSYLQCTVVSTKPYATVYYIKINFELNTLYKIGYTSRSIEARVKDFKLQPGTTVDLVASLTLPLIEAKKFEKILHTRCRNTYDSYTCSQWSNNQQQLTSGNTELYLRDVLKLDTGANARIYTAVVKEKSSLLYCKCDKDFVAKNLTEHASYCPRYGLAVNRKG